MPSPFSRQAARARRAARKRGLRADLSLWEWSETVEDFGGVCAYCGRSTCCTLDHFISLAHGGSSSIGNCVPSCDQCNNLKGSLPVDQLWFVPQKTIALIQQYLHRRLRGQRGWPPPLKKERSAMSTKDMQWSSKTYSDGKKIVLYSDTQHVVLQLRHQNKSEDDITTPTFRVAISFTPAETIALALDLLRAASPQLDQLQAQQHLEKMQAQQAENESGILPPWSR